MLAEKNGLLHPPEKLDEARTVGRRIGEAAYRFRIGRRENGFEPRIVLLRIVALAFVMRVGARHNVGIRFGRPLAIRSGGSGEGCAEDKCCDE